MHGRKEIKIIADFIPVMKQKLLIFLLSVKSKLKNEKLLDTASLAKHSFLAHFPKHTDNNL